MFILDFIFGVDKSQDLQDHENLLSKKDRLNQCLLDLRYSLESNYATKQELITRSGRVVTLMRGLGLTEYIFFDKVYRLCPAFETLILPAPDDTIGIN